MTEPELKKARVNGIEPRAATEPLTTYDWDTLGFSEKDVNGHVTVTWKDGSWGQPTWEKDPLMKVHIAAPGLNYGQQAFEGIKAFRTLKNSVHIFRPQENATRMAVSARAANMPEVPETLFLDCLRKAVAGNLEWVPPYKPNAAGGALYIRPLLLATGPMLMLGSPDEFTFIVWVSPVGSLYGSATQIPAVDAFVLDTFDRTAPLGTGHTKLGGNYAPVFRPTAEAKKAGYQITLHLDSAQHKYIDEFSTSNAIAIQQEGDDKVKVVVPESASILRSVTKLSVCEIAKDICGWEIDLRPVEFSEVEKGSFVEFMAVGTAAGITPVRSVSYNTHRPILASGGATTEAQGPQFEHPRENKVMKISFGDKAGDKAQRLFDELTSYQCGDQADRFGWRWPEEGIVAEDAM